MDAPSASGSTLFALSASGQLQATVPASWVGTLDGQPVRATWARLATGEQVAMVEALPFALEPNLEAHSAAPGARAAPDRGASVSPGAEPATARACLPGARIGDPAHNAPAPATATQEAAPAAGRLSGASARVKAIGKSQESFART